MHTPAGLRRGNCACWLAARRWLCVFRVGLPGWLSGWCLALRRVPQHRTEARSRRIDYYYMLLRKTLCVLWLRTRDQLQGEHSGARDSQGNWASIEFEWDFKNRKLTDVHDLLRQLCGFSNSQWGHATEYILVVQFKLQMSLCSHREMLAVSIKPIWVIFLD